MAKPLKKGKRCRFFIKYGGVDVSGKGRILDTGLTYVNVHIIEVDMSSIPKIVQAYYGNRIAVKKENVKIL